jgi:hypothetical protein
MEEAAVKRRSPLITLMVTLGALVLILSLNDALIPKPGGAPPADATPAPSASGTPLKSPDAVFVGKDGTGDMAVGIAIKGGRAVGYLCDGKTVEAWLSGTATAGRVTLQEPNGPGTVFADINGTRITGIAVARDDEFDFDLEKAESPAGLYRQQADDTKIGWIVYPDGGQVGIATTGGQVRPAPVLDPTSGTAERVTGQTRLGGDTDEQ